MLFAQTISLINKYPFTERSHNMNYVSATVSVIIIGMMFFTHTAVAEPQSSPLALWYAQPAERWMEALPVGNGRVGAMVFGGVETARIALNEATVWSGEPSDQA
jgi:alpha-L-fucosidase 2